MIKVVYFNGRSLAFVGGSDLHVCDQRLKMMMSPLPEGYKRLYLTELDSNVKINLELIKKYYITKYKVERYNIKAYGW